MAIAGHTPEPEHSRMVPIALVQMRSGVEPVANADAAEALIRTAAAAGARLIATPEATNIVQRDGDALRAVVVPAADDVVYQRLAALARELGVWILAGSLMVRADDGGVANRAHVFDAAGALAASYDKIHLFDVILSGRESYAESNTVSRGDRAVLTSSPVGPLGLTVCYDLRFPQLYRALAQAGACVIAAPAAFTRHTGRAHWELLVRARAVETGAFVLAPAQGGVHEDGRATWGRSMVADPWGEVVAKLDHDEPGVLTAQLDLAAVARTRGKIPSLQHDQSFVAPEPLAQSDAEDSATPAAAS